MRKLLLIVTGFLFLALGVLGAIFPVLPATPFLLVTTACFAKGSKRFDQWFRQTVFYREYIEKPMKKKCMSKKEKTKMVMTLLVLFSIGIYVCPIWYAKAIIAIVALGHFYYFLFRVRNEEA